MGTMPPARRARQAAIMRERWATQREAMLAATRPGAEALRQHQRTWRDYHAARGHDGGYSAAIADGAYEPCCSAAFAFTAWEATHEPPWDIGWGDLGPGRPYQAATAPEVPPAPWAWPQPEPLVPFVRPAQYPARWWAHMVGEALRRDADTAARRAAAQRRAAVRRCAAREGPPRPWPPPPPPAGTQYDIAVEYADGCAYWRCPHCRVLQCQLDTPVGALLAPCACSACGVTFSAVAAD